MFYIGHKNVFSHEKLYVNGEYVDVDPRFFKTKNVIFKCFFPHWEHIVLRTKVDSGIGTRLLGRIVMGFKKN
jgi:hypothetical protein